MVLFLARDRSTCNRKSSKSAIIGVGRGKDCKIKYKAVEIETISSFTCCSLFGTVWFCVGCVAAIDNVLLLLFVVLGVCILYCDECVYKKRGRKVSYTKM